jgi:hypothetical protein
MNVSCNKNTKPARAYTTKTDTVLSRRSHFSVFETIRIIMKLQLNYKNGPYNAADGAHKEAIPLKIIKEDSKGKIQLKNHPNQPKNKETCINRK